MIACLNVPYFAAAVEDRDNDLPRGKLPGLVLGGQPWEPQPVYAFSREVAKRGVKPGMSLRLAHVITPDAFFKAADPPRYFNVSAEITDILSDFTHLIEPELLWNPSFNSQHKAAAAGRRLPARFNVDLENLNERDALSLAGEIGQQVRRHTHMTPAIGMARSKFAAQVAAALTQPNHARSISSGEEAQFLSSRSIAFLPLNKGTSRRLTLLGIRTLGQLTALPISALQAQLSRIGSEDSRFSIGPDIATIYALAKGEDYSTLHSIHEKSSLLLDVQPVEQELIESLSFKLDPPITNLAIVQNILKRIADELAGRLQRQNSSCRTIQLTVSLEEPTHPDLSCQFNSRNPTANPEHLSGILMEQFINLWSNQDQKVLKQTHQDGINELTVILKDISSTSAWQLSLFQPVKGAVRGFDVIKNLIGKHGNNYFYTAIENQARHPLPDQRFKLQELIPV